MPRATILGVSDTNERNDELIPLHEMLGISDQDLLVIFFRHGRFLLDEITLDENCVNRIETTVLVVDNLAVKAELCEGIERQVLRGVVLGAVGLENIDNEHKIVKQQVLANLGICR